MRMLTQTLKDLVALLGWDLPPWALSAFLLCVALPFFPGFYRNSRTKRARKRLAALSLGGALTTEQEDEILGLVQNNPFGLVVVVEEAHKRGMKRLCTRALDDLRATGKKVGERKRLERLLGLDKPTTLDAEVLAVERLLETGLVQQAQVRLDAALARWPDHPELVDLSERLAQ